MKRHALSLLSLALAAAVGASAAADADPAQAAAPAAQRILAKLTKKYGADCLYEVDDALKLVFATNTDADTLRELRQRLTDHARALQGDLFAHGLTNYTAVVVPRKWPGTNVSGHFYPDYIDARTMGSSLLHEFTHALHFADQFARGQQHPIWIVEGLTTLFETAEIVDGRAVPRESDRLADLQEHVRTRTHVPLEKFLRFERRQFTSHHYGQAGTLMLYLHRQNKLKPWYDAYVAGYAADPSGVEALEQVFGASLAEIEKQWTAWVLTLTPPPDAPAPGQPSLGILSQEQADGIRIAGLLPGGGAERAGMATNDVIVAVGGRRVWEGADLRRAVAARRVGDTVSVDYRRNGAKARADVTLAPLPPPGPVAAASEGDGRK